MSDQSAMMAQTIAELHRIRQRWPVNASVIDQIEALMLKEAREIQRVARREGFEAHRAWLLHSTRV